MRIISDQVAKVLFFTSLGTIVVLSAWSFGIVVGKFEVWPYRPVDIMYNHIKAFISAGEWVPEGRVVRAPATASRQRVVVHRPKELMPGYRAIMGWDRASKEHTIWLLNDHGNEIHSWIIDQRTLDAGNSFGGGHTPHGMKVLQDGSVLVNFDDATALMRLDSCGRPIWAREDGVYHHSIEEAEDGSFWTWRGDQSKASPHQYLVNFAPATGETLKQFSLIDDFLKNSSSPETVFGAPKDFEYGRSDNDIFHPNDIEPLRSGLADHFPQFRAGDLLISIRTPNLVAVLDPIETSLKWWSHGPWSFQHDPDFEPDGKIWIYDNNRAYEESRIIAIDPKTKQVETAFSSGESKFYSRTMGKHQRLPNSTRLIVVPDEGRVLETLQSGDLVFEFNNILNEGFNAHVQNAQWLPSDFFGAVPSC